MIDLVITSDRENRPLFALIEEPHFLRRYVKPWILSGFEERVRVDEERKKLLE